MGAGTRQGIYKALAVDLQVLDVAALREGDDRVPGVYLAARTGGKTAGTGIDGGTSTAQRVQIPPPISVYMSRDGGTTFHLAASLTTQATMGFLMSTENDFMQNLDGLGLSDTLQVDSGATLSTAWDRLSLMPIQWFDGYVPTSTTEAELLNGENRIVVGSEVMHYQTVSTNPRSSDFGSVDLTSQGIYWHSDLLRGRRGSENEIAGQDSTKTCIAVNDAVTFFPLHPADLNRSLVFRAVSFGGDVTTASDVTITPTGKNVMPFAPANVRGVRDASNNITISWDRRTRSEVRLFGTPAFPYGEDTDNYEVEILSVPEPRTVLRTISVTGASSTTYTAANQTSDGLTPGDTMYLKVRQLSNVAGKGIQGEWSIPANAGGAGTPTPSATLYGTRLD